MSGITLPLRATRHSGRPAFARLSLVTALVAVSMGGLVGCGQSSGGGTAAGTGGTASASAGSAMVARTPSNSTATGDTAASVSGGVPAVVTAIGNHGEDLYDAVSAGAWGRARAIADSLRTAVNQLPSTTAAPAGDRQGLVAELDSIQRALAARQKGAGLKGANRVTYLAAQMTAPYHPMPPAAIALLDYYGRELEIWAAENNMAKLNQTSADLQTTWNGVRADVVSHGGAAQARHTDSLVTRVAAAKSAGAYARTAKPVLDEVDELEKVFTK